MNLNKLRFLVSLTAISLFLFSSCSKDDDTTISQPYQATKLPNDVSELFIAEGNVNADTVWIYEQGGPAGELDEKNLKEFPNYENYLRVYVHQILTFNNDLYNKELTIEQGETETDLNTEILHKVIQHFKNQGKTVIVIGHSYGAFVVTKYLADKGSFLADKYVIMAGRLDAEKEFYEGVINKKYYYFPDFITPTLHPTIQPTNNKQEIELFLAGIIGNNRYTQELSNIDLSKVIYSFAYDDDALGRLTKNEKDFLSSKNVQVVEIANGGHGAMFDSPHNQTIYDLMIE